MSSDFDTRTVQAEMRRSIVAAFCKAINEGGFPPMTVMGLAATAIGSIYREVADQHRSGGSCPCGWQPDPDADLELLQAALAIAMQASSLPDLRVVQVAGCA